MAEVLPTAEKVESISVKFYHRELKRDVEFKATAEDWNAIRSHLMPAKHDPNPAKWIVLGTVKMIKKDGQPFHVELYRTSGGPGAFASGDTYEQRKYFRGGKTSELLKALNAAFKKSRE